MKPTLAEQTAVNSFPCWNRENQAIEEMAELTAVLIRSRRKDRTIPKYDIKLELIHVQQSINMLNLIYFNNEQDYKNMYDFEDKRLQKSIDNDKMHRGLLQNMETPIDIDATLEDYNLQVLSE
jgi:hypothetical protein